MKTAINIILAILLLDFVCFLAWLMAGQTPPDGMYLGMITRNIIKLII